MFNCVKCKRLFCGQLNVSRLCPMQIGKKCHHRMLQLIILEDSKFSPEMAKSKLYAISAIPLRIKARRWRCRLRFVSERLAAGRGLCLANLGGQWLSSDLPKAQFLKKSEGILHLNDDKTPACNSSEAVRALCRVYYSHTGNGGHSGSLSYNSRWECPSKKKL